MGWRGGALRYPCIFLARLALEFAFKARRQRAVFAICPCDLRRLIRERNPAASHRRNHSLLPSGLVERSPVYSDTFIGTDRTRLRRPVAMHLPGRKDRKSV